MLGLGEGYGFCKNLFTRVVHIFLDRFITIHTTGVLQFNTMRYNIVNSNSDLLSNSVTYGFNLAGHTMEAYKRDYFHWGKA